MHSSSLEGLEEEGLPKNPDIHLVQLKFLLTVEGGVNREEVWTELIAAIKENCRLNSDCPLQLISQAS